MKTKTKYQNSLSHTHTPLFTYFPISMQLRLVRF